MKNLMKYIAGEKWKKHKKKNPNMLTAWIKEF